MWKRCQVEQQALMIHACLNLYSYYCSDIWVFKCLWRGSEGFKTKLNRRWFFFYGVIFISKGHTEFCLQQYWMKKCCSQKWSCPKNRNGSPCVGCCCCACLSVGSAAASRVECLHFQWRNAPSRTWVPEQIVLWGRVGDTQKLVSNFDWHSSWTEAQGNLTHLLLLFELIFI